MMQLYTYKEIGFTQVLLTSNGEALTGLYFQGQKHQPSLEEGWIHASELEIFHRAGDHLEEYMGGKRQEFHLPLAFTKGTPFQQKVWHALRSVPYGQTLSYQKLAEAINLPRGSRPVGSAVGRNPLSVIVPCHRIVGSDGSLTGYAGGLRIKKLLLELESFSL